jgi:8-oxo-dGTP pyrophosphatase MutT (NUDIX family)
MTDIFIEKLIKRHAEGLPGRPFQMKKAVLSRQMLEAPPTARQSAVLILLFPKNGEWHIVLTERTGNPNDPHSNQISFPGGSLDPDDADLAFCALRETHEEVGILPQTIQLIGKMTDIYIDVSNFQVHPFLAWTDAPPQYKRQVTEVKHIIETPISVLQHPDNQKKMNMTIRGYQLTDVPYFDVFGKVVWGATAMILAEFLELMNA